LKQKVSRAVHKQNASLLEQAVVPAFWQRRFYDFNIWTEAKLREKLDYMHRNPVDRQLVAHPGLWPWSSWSFYEKGEAGLIRIDILKPRSAES
jgi:putative transposase